jgi:hypothetical protein
MPCSRHHSWKARNVLGRRACAPALRQRWTPPLMIAAVALGIADASIPGGQGGPPGWRWAAAAAWIAALTCTVIFNVPVNLATGRWDPEHPPENWKQVRNRWEFFQGLRSWLLLAGFVLAAAGFAIG